MPRSRPCCKKAVLPISPSGSSRMVVKVLIVEDEPIVAFQIEDILREAGFEIVGCVGSLDKALSTVKNIDCDVAVLDANLRGDSVVPVATALHQRGTPFLFVSGYERIH